MFNCLKGIDGISNTDIDILNYLHEIITTDTICLLFDDIDDSILPEDELTILRTLSTTDYHEESKRYVQYFNYSIYNVIINKLFSLCDEELECTCLNHDSYPSIYISDLLLVFEYLIVKITYMLVNYDQHDTFLYNCLFNEDVEKTLQMSITEIRRENDKVYINDIEQEDTTYQHTIQSIYKSILSTRKKSARF